MNVDILLNHVKSMYFFDDYIYIIETIWETANQEPKLLLGEMRTPPHVLLRSKQEETGDEFSDL